MAVLGFHLVLTLVAATVLSKITARFSFCDWLIFKRLRYYLLVGEEPGVDAGQSTSDGKPRRRKRDGKRQEGNRDAEDDSGGKLLSLPLSSRALSGAPYYDLLTWATNYFVFALAVFAISDLFVYLFPMNHDRNTSLTWVLCSIVLFLYLLGKLTAVRLTSAELTSDRSLLACFSALAFFTSTLFIMFGHRLVDADLHNGYSQLTSSLNNYLRAQELEPIFQPGEKPPLLVILALSAVTAVTATILLFPTMQYSSMYVGALNGSNNKLVRLALHTAFLLPMLLLMTHTLPVKEHLVNSSLALDEESLDICRLVLLAAWVVMRFLTAGHCLQAFLDTPIRKMSELQFGNLALKWEEKRRRIGYYASYFCATALQYYLPVCTILSVGLMLKSFGNISFMASLTREHQYQYDNAAGDEYVANNTTLDPMHLLLDSSVQRLFWRLALISLLAINTVLCLFGLIYERSFN